MPVHSHTSLDSASLLESIAVVAIEHEGSLDMLRLVGLIDLYAHHLREAEGRPTCSFEAFVRDSLALGRAASRAAAESGVDTVAPAPIGADGDTAATSAEGLPVPVRHRPVGVERVSAPSGSPRMARRARETIRSDVRLRIV